MENTLINSEDYKKINGYIGYSIGFNSEVLSFTKLENELIERFKSYLIEAKGVLIKYRINEEQSLFAISELMEKLNDFISDDCEIVFGTDVDSELKINECKFNIQIAGIDKI